MQVLMLSSSRRGSEAYLEHAQPMIMEHLKGITDVLFIPFAGVTISWDDYTAMVQDALPQLTVTGVHQTDDSRGALAHAKAILVGGGNTFNLLNQLYQQQLFTTLQHRINDDVPYIGWSAGSNICGNSIRTTNDMPIVQPESFSALCAVPFQINPHFTDYQPPGHNGETRTQRLLEFCTLNPSTPVVAIREGSALRRVNDKLTLLGDNQGHIFTGDRKVDISPAEDISHLLR